MHILLERLADGLVRATSLSPTTDEVIEAEELPAAGLPGFVRGRERKHVGTRWVWDDTARWYPGLLRAGVWVERCHDLTLCHAILRASTAAAGSALARGEATAWDERTPTPVARRREAALFDLEPSRPGRGRDARAEYAAQREAVAGARSPGALRLLLAAESAGALAAAEMGAAGIPWSVEEHDRLLTDALGPRPAPGARPRLLEGLVAEIRERLDAPRLNPDSAPDLLRALRRAGIGVSSTRSGELERVEHPAVAPLLAYKKGARLLAANGWAWADEWVESGRFRPDYVPSGVVSGRWATSGGGALQIPRMLRSAVVADPGWRLVVADAAQLEPRVLTGMARDEAMAAAGRGRDLYAGIVETGVVDERAQAKVAMLGALYGSTTGDSARLLPRLTRAYPRAIGVVERAARAGERGRPVSSVLGRSTPRREQAAPGAEEGDVRAARAAARDWGRFTRNFVVQATAAEWALCWMAGVRRGLHDLGGGVPPWEGPHLVYFLHDELMVHSPAGRADEVAAVVKQAAAEAGRLLFGGFPVEFPVAAAVVADYSRAK